MKKILIMLLSSILGATAIFMILMDNVVAVCILGLLSFIVGAAGFDNSDVEAKRSGEKR